jgi:hypothetical protein
MGEVRILLRGSIEKMEARGDGGASSTSVRAEAAAREDPVDRHRDRVRLLGHDDRLTQHLLVLLALSLPTLAERQEARRTSWTSARSTANPPLAPTRSLRSSCARECGAALRRPRRGWPSGYRRVSPEGEACGETPFSPPLERR